MRFGAAPSSGGSLGSTIQTAEVDDGAITLPKMADLAQDAFIVRTTASTGVPQTATCTAAARTVLDDTTVAAMVDTLGGATSLGTGGLVRGTSPTLTTPALGTPSSGVLTNCTGLPLAGMVDLAQNRIVGRVSSGTGVPEALTAANIRTVAGLDTRSFQFVVFPPLNSVATGDGAFYFTVPAEINTWILTAVHARVITAGTTNTTDIQIHNVTDAVDMLSTKLTIDSAETGSDTAAAAAVINTSNDDVATNDLLRIDVDAVSTTPPKGLIVRLQFSQV